MAESRLKHKFAAMLCHREGGKSESKVHDVVQHLDDLTDHMAEEMLKENSDFIRTEVVDMLEMDARKKFRKMRNKARASKALKK